MWVVARTTGDPVDLMADARQVVRSLDPAMPAISMKTLEDVISESIAPRRFPMLLLGLFAAIAVGLAAVGLRVAWWRMASACARQEIGIRMAIGAGRGDVMRMIVTGGMRVALIGVLVGIAGALALSRLLRTMLFGVTVVDPGYAATALMLLAVAAFACYIPIPARHEARSAQCCASSSGGKVPSIPKPLSQGEGLRFNWRGCAPSTPGRVRVRALVCSTWRRPALDDVFDAHHWELGGTGVVGADGVVVLAGLEQHDLLRFLALIERRRDRHQLDGARGELVDGVGAQ